MGRHEGPGEPQQKPRWVPFVGFALTLVVLGVLTRFAISLLGDFSSGDGLAGVFLVVAAAGILVCLVLELQFGVQLYELATGRTLDAPRPGRGGRRAKR